MPKYNKLVRDLIPDIIRLTGKTPSVRTLTEDEFAAALKRKLREETTEYVEAENDLEALKELADILEVVRALAELHGVTFDEVEEIREKKALERGSFHERLYLKEVTE